MSNSADSIMFSLPEQRTRRAIVVILVVCIPVYGCRVKVLYVSFSRLKSQQSLVKKHSYMYLEHGCLGGSSLIS